MRQRDPNDPQQLWRSSDAATLERRFFERVNVAANGELLWATKKMFGRVSNHRAFLVTQNISRDGAKLLLDDVYHFPNRSRARLKLGLEFCEVEILDAKRPGNDRTILRVTFVNPGSRFNQVVQQYLPIGNEFDRVVHETKWTGL